MFPFTFSPLNVVNFSSGQVFNAEDLNVIMNTGTSDVRVEATTTGNSYTYVGSAYTAGTALDVIIGPGQMLQGVFTNVECSKDGTAGSFGAVGYGR